MAQNRSQLERQLRTGIRAARTGNEERAREILTAVLRVDRRNELAWIWLAEVVATRQERRRCLEEVLKINPANRPARETLNSLVGVVGSGESATFDVERIAAASKVKLSDAPRRTSATQPGRPGGGGGLPVSPMLLALGGLAIVLVIALAVLVVPTLTPIEPTPTATEIPPTPTQPMLDPETGRIITPTLTPTPIIPTATIGARVTRADGDSLPPTFTPQPTATATQTPLPTATLPPLDTYTLYYTAEVGDVTALYRSDASGGQASQLANNILDFAISRDGSQIAFTREVSYGADTAPDGSVRDAGTAVELFLAPLSNIENAQQLTNVRVGTVSSPSFAPDGQRIVYASDQDGDSEIYIYNIASGIITAITENTNVTDTDPDWSPDGNSIVYSSTQSSVAAALFIYDTRDQSITRLNQASGNSLRATWSNDGEQIAYVNDNQTSNVQIVSADGTRIISLTTSAQEEISPSFSSDDDYVAYLIGQVDQYEIEIIALAGRQTSRVPVEAGLSLRQVAFAPN